MRVSNLQPRIACLELASVLLLCSVAQGEAANHSSQSQNSQSQDVNQQTNDRGAIGMYCAPEGNDCRIKRITKSSPAERAGLRVGDLVLRLDPADSASATEQVAKNAPGAKITLPVQRGSEHMKVEITVEDQLAVARRGAALGDASGQETIGGIYLRGTGVPKNSAEAFKWFRKAAEQGLDTAEYAMAWMYEHSEGVPKDDAAAADWYRKSADQGYAPQLLLGAMYVQGRGLPKDDKAAAECFRKAADQGVADAQNELGSMYARGVGVAQDYQAAAEWYRKAAEKGDATAEYNLGFCYELGRGVPKDLATAVAWYKKAAEQGFEPAKEKLAKLQH